MSLPMLPFWSPLTQTSRAGQVWAGQTSPLSLSRTYAERKVLFAVDKASGASDLLCQLAQLSLSLSQLVCSVFRSNGRPTEGHRSDGQWVIVVLFDTLTGLKSVQMETQKSGVEVKAVAVAANQGWLLSCAGDVVATLLTSAMLSAMLALPQDHFGISKTSMCKSGQVYHKECQSKAVDGEEDGDEDDEGDGGLGEGEDELSSEEGGGAGGNNPNGNSNRNSGKAGPEGESGGAGDQDNGEDEDEGDGDDHEDDDDDENEDNEDDDDDDDGDNEDEEEVVEEEPDEEPDEDDEEALQPPKKRKK
ncbi:hypothetical protein FNV43_RR10924 [Rhamnella rubrinervis]|uniref:Uncharacterized protein n=1 Tax=Rhamnella rubrinervis TaxID=2594499 RepID=A0A8K0MH94_9ROSA|nr:hypothetical protein FNV43_RR10924 [Rhamnella rubrinervis]